MILLCALAVPIGLAAQESANKPEHHHYKVVDVGTFAGPQSYYNNLHLTDRFGFVTAFYGFAQVQ